MRPLHLAVGVLALSIGSAVDAQDSATSTSADGSTCSAGRIAEIRIDTRPVFIASEDASGPLRWIYGLGNLIHVETRHGFVASELLFEVGDCYDPFLVEESERLLDDYGFLTNVEIGATETPEGVVLDVRTRDEWSTQIDLGVTYDDGVNVESFRAEEQNFMGYGISAALRYRERREERVRTFSVSTPRLFWRTNASFEVGESRGRTSIRQQFSYRFVGEATDFSAAESLGEWTDFFSFTTGSRTGVSNILVPIRHQRLELAAARRFGDPGESVILGASFERDVRRSDGPIQAVIGGDFDALSADSSTVPDRIGPGMTDRGASRLAVHLGTRRYRYIDVVGFDAVRENLSVGVGYFAGLTVGRDLGLFQPDDLPDEDEWYTRVHGTFGFPIGDSFVYGRTTAEIGLPRDGWRDLYAEADLVGYGRADWLPAQTLFFRASWGGGWRTTMPFQLALGGRDGVRSLRDDEYPGGRRLVLTLEDRIALPWPSDGMDLGVTLIADAGRIWAGDAPYGADSGWYGSAGFGLRIGFPTGTKYVMRPDIVFPVGRSGSPVFRMTFELNRLRGGFSLPKMGRSRRFTRGPEHF